MPWAEPGPSQLMLRWLRGWWMCAWPHLRFETPAAPALSPSSPAPPPLVQGMKHPAPNDGELLRHHPSGTGLQHCPSFAPHCMSCRSPRSDAEPRAGKVGCAGGAVPWGRMPHPAPGPRLTWDAVGLPINCRNFWGGGEQRAEARGNAGLLRLCSWCAYKELRCPTGHFTGGTRGCGMGTWRCPECPASPR